MKDIETIIRQYLVERGWDGLRPSDLAKSISIEAAELLEIFQWNSLTIAETQADAGKMARIKSELADVLIYALDMAVLLRIDSAQIIKDKIAKINQKYPADVMKKNAQKETGSGNDPVYLKIQQDYRKK